MTFEATTTAAGVRLWAVDGCSVPQQVYDTLLPSKLFPADTGMTEAEALMVLDFLKSTAPPPEPHKGPYLQTGTTLARPQRSEALAVHTSQIPAVLERNKRHGISVRYDRVGRPVFTDAGQRKALMRLEKVRKMNSYDGY